MKPQASSSIDESDNVQPLTKRVLVAVANPNTEDNLLKLALILAKTADGTLLPLQVLSDNAGRVAPEARMLQNQLLAATETIAHAAACNVEPIGRVIVCWIYQGNWWSLKRSHEFIPIRP